MYYAAYLPAYFVREAVKRLGMLGELKKAKQGAVNPCGLLKGVGLKGDYPYLSKGGKLRRRMYQFFYKE